MIFKQDEDETGVVALLATNFNSSSEECTFRFWYWLSNPYYSNLRILIKKSIKSDPILLANIFDSTTTWSRTEVKIPQSDSPFQVWL